MSSGLTIFRKGLTEMSSQKYDWTTNVEWMVRNYPHRITEAAELGQKMPPAQLQEYKSVTAAIEILGGRPGGPDKVKLIKSMYWEGRSVKPLSDAATEMGQTIQKAKQWKKEFFWIVAEQFGYVKKATGLPGGREGFRKDS